MTLKKLTPFLATTLLTLCIPLAPAQTAPATSRALEKAKIASAKTDIAAIETALQAFKIDNGRFPTTTEGLQALVTKAPRKNNLSKILSLAASV